MVQPDALQQHIIDPSKMDGCIRTLSGIKFNLIDPRPEMVRIADIAAGLSNKPHFGGQTERFFSIAEHSLLVETMACADSGNPLFLLYCLLHDASEAYLVDMPKPAKVHLPDFQAMEKRIERVINEHFLLDALPAGAYTQMKNYDMAAQNIEYRSFYKGFNLVEYHAPDVAKQLFMSRFDYLAGEIVKEFPSFPI